MGYRKRGFPGPSRRVTEQSRLVTGRPPDGSGPPASGTGRSARAHSWRNSPA